jgi:hypothetical protein
VKEKGMNITTIDQLAQGEVFAWPRYGRRVESVVIGPQNSAGAVPYADKQKIVDGTASEWNLPDDFWIYARKCTVCQTGEKIQDLPEGTRV